MISAILKAKKKLHNIGDRNIFNGALITSAKFKYFIMGAVDDTMYIQSTLYDMYVRYMFLMFTI